MIGMKILAKSKTTHPPPKKKFLFQNMYNNVEILDQYSLIDKKFRFIQTITNVIGDR